MKVVDLFCGCGGFSEGARLAGHDVALAVDNDERALLIHKLNHPKSNHICANLPDQHVENEIIKYIKKGAHVHGSPPCQKLSQANRVVTKEQRERAVHLVKWFLDIILKHKPLSWSFEQVSTPEVNKILSEYLTNNDKLFHYNTFDFSNFGVPQTRKRLIAGTPNLIHKLSYIQKTLSHITHVIPDTPSTHIQSNTTNTPDRKGSHRPLLPTEKIRTVHGPSYTILASSYLSWSDSKGTVLRKLTPREGALIQSFPLDYIFKGLPSTVMQRLVGNAFSPLMAKTLMSHLSQQIHNVQ